MNAQFIVVLSIAGFVVVSTAFFQPRPSSRSKTTTGLASSYLDSLNGASGTMKIASYGITGSSYNVPEKIVGSYQVPAPTGSASPSTGQQASEKDQSSSYFPFAPASYFGMEHLASKGPRATADWGTPADGTRKLCDDGIFRAGAWFCSQGGWPSPNLKAHTEVFYVLEGYGSLDDADGVRHYFGPGDNVIIPKGHTGRWDVNQPIRKVWAVNDHDKIEESGSPIRVQVDHYNTWAPHCLKPNTDGNDPLYGFISDATVISSTKTFYDVGPTQVGVWSSEPGSYAISHGKRAWIHVLEGALFVTNGVDKSARRCVAGDTIVLPQGWFGHVDVLETTKKLWTVAE